MINDIDVLPLGPDGMLVRFSDQLSEPANRAALAFRAVVDAMELPGVSETATSLTSVFLRFRPTELTRSNLEEIIRKQLGTIDWHAASLPEGRNLWRVPVVFGGVHGPDLDECADLAGVSADVAINQICAEPLRVLALGFAPGQPYLGFLPSHWNISRKTDVTPEVPRGALVVAVRQVIPFANPAPTGWRQIGRTAFRCYDPKLEPAIPLNPGDEMEFHPISAARFDHLMDTSPAFGGAEKTALK